MRRFYTSSKPIPDISKLSIDDDEPDTKSTYKRILNKKGNKSDFKFLFESLLPRSEITKSVFDD